MFCGCSTKFGSPPNTQTCPVCQGLPGVLPVINKTAFEHALKAALALNCEIAPITSFDRKNYYYPDLPKNYQISQNHQNLGVNGWIDLDVNADTRRVRIWNVHLEEDAGKLEHPEDTGARHSAVDLNRTGTPLLEIVTAPDMCSADEAMAYMNSMASLLRYLAISDCKMEEGSIRFEAGISVRPAGTEKLGNRVEVKNLNSMRAVYRAITFEIDRQIGELKAGGKIPSQTMLWDDARGVTEPMRSKEEAKDYRYFPEPDLVPVEISRQWLDELRSQMPEFPAERRRRFISQYALPAYDAGVIIENRPIADYFEQCISHGAPPKQAANWLMGEVMRELNERKLGIGQLQVTPHNLAALIKSVADGEVSNLAAKEVFAEMASTGKPAQQIIEEKGFRQISDTSALESAVRDAFAANPAALAELKAGKTQTKGWFVGQVMKSMKGKANPKLVGEIIDKLMAE